MTEEGVKEPFLKRIGEMLGDSLRRNRARNVFQLYGSFSTEPPVESYRTITVVLKCRSASDNQALEEQLGDVAQAFKTFEHYFPGAIIKGVRTYVRKPPHKKKGAKCG